jgi:DNA-binding GntR family transcriptional regulator
MRLWNFKKDNSLSEKVYQRIYKKIVSGTLKGGDKITEAGISNSMSISRAPVREALKRLAEDHLVVLVPRSGCFVAKLSNEEVNEIYEIRKRLECMALEYAFEKLDINEVKDLKDEFQKCLDPAWRERIKKEIQLDSQLHKMISKMSRCKNLEELLAKLRARIQVFRVQEADYVARADDAIKEHIDLLDAIIAGNKSAAIESLARHIEHTKNNVLSNLRNWK